MSKEEDFFKAYAPYAQAEEKRSGIPASVTLAQAANESGWSLSELTRKALNFFGIKADSRWDGEKVYMPTKEWNGKEYVSVVAPFRKYDNPADSFKDHTDFLMNNKRYAEHGVFSTNDPYKVAQALQSAGYGTSPTYAQNLGALIKEYNLTQYDGGTPAGSAGTPSPGTPGIITGGFKLPDLNPLPKWETIQGWLGNAGRAIAVTVIILLLLIGIGYGVFTLSKGSGGE